MGSDYGMILGLRLGLAHVSGRAPATSGMTATATWDTVGTAYTTLANRTQFSARVEGSRTAGQSGILFEGGGIGTGCVLYITSDTLYFQAGDGTAFGADANTGEASCPAPVGAFLIEVSGDSTKGIALYVGGVLQDTSTFSHTALAGGEAGTIGQSETSVPVNRGGWSGDAAGTFAGTVDFAIMYVGQVTADVAAL